MCTSNLPLQVLFVYYVRRRLHLTRFLAFLPRQNQAAFVVTTMSFYH
jgi:hypothetical protein